MALAIFDLDETLIHGDCATLWSEQMGRLGWVDPGPFMQRNSVLLPEPLRPMIEITSPLSISRSTPFSTWF